MVTERIVMQSDREPISVEGGDVCCVEEFPYLGSLKAASGWIVEEYSKSIPSFWSSDKKLALATKRKMYQACVLSILLYGAECWIPLRGGHHKTEHLSP